MHQRNDRYTKMALIYLNTNKSDPKRDNLSSKMGNTSNNNSINATISNTKDNDSEAKHKFHGTEHLYIHITQILHNLYDGILLD